jgi:hypothetical protein
MSDNNAAPTADPDRAGTAPVDPVNIAPKVDDRAMEEGAEAAADAAGAEGEGRADPVGGEALEGATAWAGERDDDRLTESGQG